MGSCSTMISSSASSSTSAPTVRRGTCRRRSCRSGTSRARRATRSSSSRCATSCTGARCATSRRLPIPRRSRTIATASSSNPESHRFPSCTSPTACLVLQRAPASNERAPMNFIAVVVALALEQWRTLRWRGAIEHAYVRYIRLLETKLNGGTAQHGAFAAAAALVPPVLLAGGVFWLLYGVHPALGLVWNIAWLYFLMGFRRFSHAYSDVVAALRAGDINGARRALASWRGASAGELGTDEVARL